MKNFLLKIFGSKYYILPFIYTDLNNEFSRKITSKIYILDGFIVFALSQKSADEKAFKVLDEKYPQYKDNIYFF